MKNNRITADGVMVSETDLVYEILYHYYNAEVSLAEPHQTESKNVPLQYPVWRFKLACQKRCWKLNSQIENKIFAGQ